jgi:DNA polymerase-3 subunit gamma/tau
MTLYRAYRPTQFHDVLGQESVVLTLQRALLLDRVSHAYLFSGPRGTGKTSTARLFARAVCCLTPKKNLDKNTYEPCGTCVACTSIIDGSAMDIIEIDAASNRGIEDIRELREGAQYPPLQLKRKVYIIDEVHMLTIDAFNALLKTLEEPAPHCLFILATTELHKVPATVRSRCQPLKFNAATLQVLTKKLEKIITKEGWQFEKGVAELIANTSGGSFRDAESLLEKLGTEHNTLTVNTTSTILGVQPLHIIQNTLSLALAGNGLAATTTLDQLSTEAPLEAFMQHLIEHLRSEVRSGIVDQRSGSFALQQLLEAYILTKSSPTPRLPLEIALLTIAENAVPTATAVIPTATPVATAIPIHDLSLIAVGTNVVITPKPAAPTSVPVVEINPTEPSPQAEPAPTSKVPSPVANGDVRKAWKQMIDMVCRENMVLGQTLKQSILHTAENGMVIVRYRFHADKLNEKKNHAQIHQILAEQGGAGWNIQYEVVESVPRQKPKRALESGMDDAVAVFGTGQ